jgi:hypothetical protein
MPPALWTLLRLNFRATLRRMLRGVRTPRGLTFLLLSLLCIVAWGGSALFRAMAMPRTDPQTFRIFAPMAMLVFCVGNLVTSVSENAVAFTAAEVDFLFPGPFSRRDLLRFKIIKTAIGTIFTALILSIVLLRYCAFWFACLVGIWLAVQFMQLFSMAVVMIGQTMGERMYSAARRGLLLGVVALAIIAAAPALASALHQGPAEFARQVRATTAGKVLLGPFVVFARAITAQSWYPQLVGWGSAALLIDLAMFTLVVGLDANYLAAADAASQRRYERMQRLRRGGAGAMSSPRQANLHVRPLPWLGGAGPIAWRQLVSALRSSRRLLILLLIIAASVSMVVLKNRGQGDSMASAFVGVAVWMNLFFVAMLKFDFRDELDRLDMLRSLPLRPFSVAAGELVAPVLVLTLLQALLLGAVVIANPSAWPLVLAAAAFAVPFNLLLVGIENLLFLMYPLRAAGLIAGDMQLFGRQMVVFLCKFLLLFIALGIAAAVGTIGYILGRQSWPAFGVVAWGALCGVALGTIPLVARAYLRFDPSMDTPP